MASKYDELDASTELEQQLAADLSSALQGRGCEVIHHGTNNGGRHSPGGKPDIEVRDPNNKRLILVEVTKRKASAAEGEFIAVTDHLDKAIAAGGYEDYGVLYVSPYTSARLSASFRDLCNRTRERDGRPGRVVTIDFAAAEMMLAKLAAAPSEEFPASRFGALFQRWEEAADDSLARLLVQQTIFPEDEALAIDLEHEVEEFAADREKRLKKQLFKIENDLRDRGVVGEAANAVVIYLTFVRLYEERRQRLSGERNRFTCEGFETWSTTVSSQIRTKYRGRMVEALLHEIADDDDDLRSAGLLRDANGKKVALHDGVRDSFVTDKVLPVFDEYDFHTGRVDVLGAVFETLAGRAEKDTKVGQFFTPQPAVDFCADFVPLRPRDLVLDPAVGTARFLIRAMQTMLHLAKADSESLQEAEEAIRTHRLLGSDIGSWVATIAKMNMFIHGDGKTNIQRANGLALGDRNVFAMYPGGLAGAVDVVLTNPPLGSTSHVVAVEHWQQLADEGESIEPNDLLDSLGVVPMRVMEEEALAKVEAALAASVEEVESLEASLPNEAAQKRLPGARRTRNARQERVANLRAQIAAGSVIRKPIGKEMKGGALFLGAIANYLKPVREPNERTEWRGGWAAVVVDEAILNTPEYGPTRAFIREHFYVKGVVSLGRQAFKYLANTDAKTSVIFLVRKPEDGKEQREPIFFAHAERVGYSATGDWIGDDLPQVKLQYDEMRDAVLSRYKGARVKSEDAMEAVEALPGYGTAFVALPDEGGSARLDYFHARFVYRVSEMRRESGGHLTTLGDFVETVERERPAANRRNEYEFAFPKRMTGTIEPKGPEVTGYAPSTLWIVREGDLVVSGIDAVNGSIGVAGPSVDGMVMSKEFYAYRVKDKKAADAVYLGLLLRSRDARELLEGLSTGTSNRTRLESAELLLSLPIPPLPPLDVQQRIAGVFTSSVASRQVAHELQDEAESSVGGLWGEGRSPSAADRAEPDMDLADGSRKVKARRKA